MRDPWSLVLFTLLVQSAVGGVWCLQAASFGGIDFPGPPHRNIYLYFSGSLAFGGLGGAFFHLGNPLHGWHALRNLKRSWLSREIGAVSAFAAALIILIILDRICPGVSNGWLLLTGTLTGGMALYAMTRVYRLRTVPSWNHAGTPLAFLSSALMLGGLQSNLLLALQTGLSIDSPRVLAQAAPLEILFMAFATAGVACRFLAASVAPGNVATAGGTRFGNRPILQAGGLAVWMIDILIIADPAWRVFVLVLAAGGLISGEVIHRMHFYRSYQRVGL